MRGFDIAKTLAGDDHSGIFLHSTVWDILQNKRIAVKDMLNHKNFYVEAQALIVATGAVPFMPTSRMMMCPEFIQRQSYRK
mgnify:FL=1